MKTFALTAALLTIFLLGFFAESELTHAIIAKFYDVWFIAKFLEAVDVVEVLRWIWVISFELEYLHTC